MKLFKWHILSQKNTKWDEAGDSWKYKTKYHYFVLKNNHRDFIPNMIYFTRREA